MVLLRLPTLYLSLLLHLFLFGRPLKSQKATMVYCFASFSDVFHAFGLSRQNSFLTLWFGTFVFGMCAGAGAVVLPSIQADIIDFDEYQSGERKEGAYLRFGITEKRQDLSWPTGCFAIYWLCAERRTKFGSIVDMGSLAFCGSAILSVRLFGTDSFEAEHAAVRKLSQRSQR